MQKITYYDEVKKQDPKEIALIIDGTTLTYATLCEKIEALRNAKALQIKEEGEKGQLFLIIKDNILEQLIYFLAYSGTQYVPVIVPKEFQGMEQIESFEIPSQACMAVMTSGTTGKSKLLFREKRSWYDYFAYQNPIFKMGKGTRIFMQGSLSFTGNLNLYMAQLCSGGTIIAENMFSPKIWMKRIETEKADVIYLIPAKLRALKMAYHRKGIVNSYIKMILSGSQSLGGKEAEELKRIFTDTEVLLYYGASELNYITYVTDQEMTEDKTLIGKAFPDVCVRVENDEIRVTTKYGILGIEGEVWIGDCGHMDENGNLYFDGRKDDICSINGRKISMLKVENALLSINYIQEAAVKAIKKEEQEYLCAWIVIEPHMEAEVSLIKAEIKEKLTSWEIPRRILIADHLPKNTSGKIVKRLLEE